VYLFAKAWRVGGDKESGLMKIAKGNDGEYLMKMVEGHPIRACPY
jgi:hypothetical protein